MKEQFKTAMVYCAAIASFGGGAYVVVEGLSSMQESKIASVVQSMNTQESNNSDTVDTAVTGAKKVLKSLLK